MKKYYRIWKRTIVPVDKEGTLLVCDGSESKKYYDKEEALKALDELAEKEFNMSKYKKKKLEEITKNDDGTFTVTYWHRNELITEKYYIM